MISKFIAFVILLAIWPVFIIVALLIIIDDGFPIIFKQKRVGQNNKHFLIFKFRSMKKETPDIATHLFENNNSHLTKIGPIIRKLSLDEIPQLVNILKGDLKFIGPRPALHNQADLIKLRNEKNIQCLVPGITGWAQVNGRDQLSNEEKVNLDSFYLLNRSFWLDLKIIFMTIYKVLLGKDVT